MFVAYGARYYDPRTSVWQSVDPVLNDYFDGKINGGVFAPKNLQLYSYTYNNPVNLVDPDGKCVNSGSSDWLGRLTQGNCSDYPTAKEVAVGVGNFLPVFGNAIATYESTSGESLSDGHKLSDTERTIAAAGIVAGPLSKVGGKVAKYSVGEYRHLKSKIKGLDAHHVGQKALMKKYIKNYDEKTAPSILVPKVGHRYKKKDLGILNKSIKIDITNPNTIKPARSVLARDIKELRRVYPDIPNTRLQELIKMNKQKYPEVRK